MQAEKNSVRGVYILHFDKKFKHAQHYVGYSENVLGRIEKHKTGNGARLMQVIHEHQIGFKVAVVFENRGRDFEHKIKGSHNTKRFCPICRTQECLAY